jgi:hypothetical protein
MTAPITKIEGARRQLDTAIDLYFDDADSLSVHMLAFASLKVLFDIYPHHQNDGFAAQLDDLLSKEGWKAISSVANFLKHADRDPDAFLTAHHPEQGMVVIGLATLLYRRVSGDFSPKMRAFDIWIEQEGHDALDIMEVDTNEARASAHKRIRDEIRALPHDAKMIIAGMQYRATLENFDKWAAAFAEAEAQGLIFAEIFDRLTTAQKTGVAS